MKLACVRYWLIGGPQRPFRVSFPCPKALTSFPPRGEAAAVTFTGVTFQRVYSSLTNVSASIADGVSYRHLVGPR